MHAVTIDLGDGIGLGKHTLPVFPPGPSSLADFMRAPYACTRQAYAHVIAYTDTVAAGAGLEGQDLADVRTWAKDFWLLECYRTVKPMSPRALEVLVQIAFDHVDWPLHRETWQRELVRLRTMLVKSKESTRLM